MKQTNPVFLVDSTILIPSKNYRPLTYLIKCCMCYVHHSILKYIIIILIIIIIIVKYVYVNMWGQMLTSLSILYIHA
jgi:hypothetical protein